MTLAAAGLDIRGSQIARNAEEMQWVVEIY
jgi:hypothetical protein